MTVLAWQDKCFVRSEILVDLVFFELGERFIDSFLLFHKGEVARFLQQDGWRLAFAVF